MNWHWNGYSILNMMLLRSVVLETSITKNLASALRHSIQLVVAAANNVLLRDSKIRRSRDLERVSMTLTTQSQFLLRKLTRSRYTPDEAINLAGGSKCPLAY